MTVVPNRPQVPRRSSARTVLVASLVMGVASCIGIAQAMPPECWITVEIACCASSGGPGCVNPCAEGQPVCCDNVIGNPTIDTVQQVETGKVGRTAISPPQQCQWEEYACNGMNKCVFTGTTSSRNCTERIASGSACP